MPDSQEPASGNDPFAAKGAEQDAVLGAQVKPETQTREDDGNRTLALPVTDPGPHDAAVKYPDVAQGHQTFRDANPEPVKIMQRHSTIPPHFARDQEDSVRETDMAVEHMGVGRASEIYHPQNREPGSQLTADAQAKAAQARVAAPALDTLGPGPMPPLDPAPAPA